VTPRSDRGLRRAVVPPARAFLAAGLLVATSAVGACGDAGGDGGSASDPRPTTAAPPADGTPSTSSSSPDGGTAPAEVGPWSTTAADVASDVGATVEEQRALFLDCPGGGPTTASVWGAGPYTDDSAVCVAAVHAGLITVDIGGTVTFGLAPGRERYEGTSANGITTQPYGFWGRSFVFLPEA
jgi:hypothetical protein